jgi:hypothetical protein
MANHCGYLQDMNAMKECFMSNTIHPAWCAGGWWFTLAQW